MAGPVDDVDLASLDEPGEAGDLLLDDVSLGLEDLRPVDLAACPDAPLLGPIDVVHDRRRLEERLRRDAAAQQTGPTELLAPFDDGDALAELRGAQGRRVST